jgi:hypothetical protein
MTTTWNPEEVITRHVARGEVIKIHEGYLPLVLSLMNRGLVRIKNHADGLIEIEQSEIAKENSNDH